MATKFFLITHLYITAKVHNGGGLLVVPDQRRTVDHVVEAILEAGNVAQPNRYFVQRRRRTIGC